jgi:hypothetical protein
MKMDGLQGNDLTARHTAALSIRPLASGMPRSPRMLWCCT